METMLVHVGTDLWCRQLIFFIGNRGHRKVFNSLMDSFFEHFLQQRLPQNSDYFSSVQFFRHFFAFKYFCANFFDVAGVLA